MVNIVRTHLIIILLYTHITITTTGTSDSVARRGGGGRKKCVSRVRVCAADQPVFSGERECVCANDAYGGGGRGRERECARPESLCERERVHVNACVCVECGGGGGTLLNARALLAERELHLFGRTLSPALQPPHTAHARR